MIRYSVIAFATTITLATAPLHAGDRTKIIFQGAIEGGGDDLITLYYTDGHSETVRAGGLLLLGGGIAYQTLADNERLQTRLTFNWKSDSTSEADGEMDWNHFPLELIQFYEGEKIAMGIGLTYHLAPSLKGSGRLAYYDVDFENALGNVFELNYKLSKTGFVGFRYTSIEYEYSNSGNTVDGSTFGISLGAKL